MTLYSSKREIFSPKPKIYSDILLIFEQGLSAFALSTVYMKETDRVTCSSCKYGTQSMRFLHIQNSSSSIIHHHYRHQHQHQKSLCEITQHPKLVPLWSVELESQYKSVKSSAGGLTSLEASLVRCFTFSETSPKTSRGDVFFKTSLEHRTVKQKVRYFYTKF